ncbi:ABC transporter ATP-binding protein [Desulfomarina sp.]
MSVLLKADNISRSFRPGDSPCLALAPLSLIVEKGEFLVITGRSGAGKSTLLNLLSGLDLPSQGEVCFKDKSLSTMNEMEIARLRNSSFGFIFQTPHLLSDRTILENVAMPFSYGKHVAHGSVEKRCRELLDYVGLGKLIHRFPTTLSGGEMQRVVFARALVREPEIIFADEPTGSLDGENSRKIMELLERQVEKGCSVVMVSHDREAGAFGTRTLRLDKVESAKGVHF